MIRDDLRVAVMFFSATGNSKRIAQKIAAFFEEKAVLIDITHKLKKSKNSENNEWIKNSLLNCDLLFVVFPVYSQLCPSPIANFFKNLHFKGMFVPCVSYGSVSAGKALKQISRIFQKKGAVILAGAEFPSSHVYYNFGDSNNYNLASNNNLNNTIIFKESRAVNELCLKVVSRLDNSIILKKIPTRHFNPLSLILPKLRAQIGVKLKCLDKNKCTECQSCKNICPYGAINKIFKISGKCQRCGYCIKNCKNNNKQFNLRPVMLRYLKKHIDYSCNTEIY